MEEFDPNEVQEGCETSDTRWELPEINIERIINQDVGEIISSLSVFFWKYGYKSY